MQSQRHHDGPRDLGNPAGAGVLRHANRRDMLRLLAQQASCSRAELGAALGLTGAAVSRITRELISAGLVTEGLPLKQKGSLGRRSTRLALNPHGGVVLAVTLTANRLQASLNCLDGSRIAAHDLPSAQGLAPDAVVAQLADHCDQLLRDRQLSSPLAVGISVATTGRAEQSKGLVTSHLLGWQDVPVASVFEQRFNCPVTIESRPTGLLRAEINAGQVTPTDRVLLVNVGVGIGMAYSFDGNSPVSSQGGLGNLAHFKHPDSDVGCDCGRTGCLQQCASGVAVVRLLNAVKPNPQEPMSYYNPYLHDAIARAEQGDQAAKDAFYTAGAHLAAGLDAAHALLDPHQIILAGEAGRQADFVEGVRNALDKVGGPLQQHQLRISQVTSDQAAACIALDAHVLGSSPHDTGGVAP
ncbi:MAG: ROK family transcriptional regulator [Pseudomonadota bacterium]